MAFRCCLGARHIMHRMSRQMSHHVVSDFLIAGVFALAACESAPPTASTSSVAPGNETNANGEAPAVTYVDSRYHYKIDGPGRMAANADGTASVIGPSERLVVSVVQGSGAADHSCAAGA